MDQPEAQTAGLRFSLQVRRDAKGRTRIEIGDTKLRRAISLPAALLRHVPLPTSVKSAAQQLQEGFSIGRRHSYAHVRFDAPGRLGKWLVNGEATLRKGLDPHPPDWWRIWQEDDLTEFDLEDYLGGATLSELQPCLSWGLHHFVERPPQSAYFDAQAMRRELAGPLPKLPKPFET